jgi:hypothetical protein
MYDQTGSTDGSFHGFEGGGFDGQNFDANIFKFFTGFGRRNGHPSSGFDSFEDIFNE